MNKKGFELIELLIIIAIIGILAAIAIPMYKTQKVKAEIMGSVSAIHVDENYFIVGLRKVITNKLPEIEQDCKKRLGTVPRSVEEKISQKKAEVLGFMKGMIVKSAENSLKSKDVDYTEDAIRNLRNSIVLFTGKDLDELKKLESALDEAFKSAKPEDDLKGIKRLMKSRDFAEAAMLADDLAEWCSSHEVSVPGELAKLRKQAMLGAAKSSLAQSKDSLKKKDMKDSWNALMSAMEFFRDSKANPPLQSMFISSSVEELAKALDNPGL